jgi:phosphatidylglycerophosphate synthase
MNHVRDHRSLLAEVERRLLVDIARRLPEWVTSDQLSLLGLLAMPAAGLAFVAIPHTAWGAPALVAALALNWFGDSLDGTLARVRNRQRPRYGYYLDHVIDVAGTVALLAGIAASGAMTPWVAMALLSAYLAVAAESYLATHALGMFRISFAGFGPTELRILLAAGGIALVNHQRVEFLGSRMLLFDVGGGFAIAGLMVAFVVSAVRNAGDLYRAEPLPSRLARKERAA